MSEHTLKVELGEFVSYRLTCNLDDTAKCHEVCVTHPDGGCGDPDVQSGCVTEVYWNGCVIAEWVNDGGIDAVGFEYTLELPVTYEWAASHDYPIVSVASTKESE